MCSDICVTAVLMPRLIHQATVEMQKNQTRFKEKDTECFGRCDLTHGAPGDPLQVRLSFVWMFKRAPTGVLPVRMLLFFPLDNSKVSITIFSCQPAFTTRQKRRYQHDYWGRVCVCPLLWPAVSPLHIYDWLIRNTNGVSTTGCRKQTRCYCRKHESIYYSFHK